MEYEYSFILKFWFIMVELEIWSNLLFNVPKWILNCFKLVNLLFIPFIDFVNKGRFASFNPFIICTKKYIMTSRVIVKQEMITYFCRQYLVLYMRLAWKGEWWRWWMGYVVDGVCGVDGVRVRGSDRGCRWGLSMMVMVVEFVDMSWGLSLETNSIFILS